MLSIYICEDDARQLKHLTAVIERHLIMLDGDVRFCCAEESPSALLSIVKAAESPGLSFLDIELKADLNGLELACEIRKIDPRAYIVFITTHDELFRLTYEYKAEALDYISKADQEQMAERICSCIDHALENQKQLLRVKGHDFVIKIERSNIVIDQDSILFMESATVPHKLLIHRKEGTLRISGSLKEYEYLLIRGFCRCSQSVLVNLSHVSEYRPGEHLLIMDNQEICRISVRMRGQVKAAWAKSNSPV